MTITEVATLLLAFFALIVSILSFAQSSLSGLRNLSEVERSNRIAEQALQIALRDHQINLTPQLVGKMMMMPDNEVSLLNQIFQFDIVNITNTKVIIEKVNSIGRFEILRYGNGIPPKVLLYNNRFIIKIGLKSDYKEYYKKQWEERELDKYPESNYRKIIENQAAACRVFVVFTNELGNRYCTKLRYNVIEDKFIGNTIQLPEDMNLEKVSYSYL